MYNFRVIGLSSEHLYLPDAAFCLASFLAAALSVPATSAGFVLAKKVPFLRMPWWQRSASRHPCFLAAGLSLRTLDGLLQGPWAAQSTDLSLWNGGFASELLKKWNYRYQERLVRNYVRQTQRNGFFAEVKRSCICTARASIYLWPWTKSAEEVRERLYTFDLGTSVREWAPRVVNWLD